MTITEAFKCT